MRDVYCLSAGLDDLAERYKYFLRHY